MKKLLLIPFILIIFLAKAQVGIGTTTPLADLHVAGDVLFTDKLKVGDLPAVTLPDEGFKLLTRVTNSTPVGEVKILDVTALKVAPINVINYDLTNISLDNLTDLDLLYDETKYVLAVANFQYLGDAIKKVPFSRGISIGNFVVNLFISGGTWHLEIRNRSLDLDAGDSLTYSVTLVVYDKSYYRNLTPIVTNLGGSNSGNASSIPVLD